MKKIVPIYATTTQMSKILSSDKMIPITVNKLKLWRLGSQRDKKEPVLKEGIHWFRLSDKDVRFNISLMKSFVDNRKNPEQHQTDIENWQKSLPSHPDFKF